MYSNRDLGFAGGEYTARMVNPEQYAKQVKKQNDVAYIASVQSEENCNKLINCCCPSTKNKIFLATTITFIASVFAMQIASKMVDDPYTKNTLENCSYIPIPVAFATGIWGAAVRCKEALTSKNNQPNSHIMEMGMPQSQDHQQPVHTIYNGR